MPTINGVFVCLKFLENFHTSLLVFLDQDHAFSFLFFEVGHLVFVFSSFGSLAAPNRSKFLIWSKVLSRQVDIVYVNVNFLLLFV